MRKPLSETPETTLTSLVARINETTKPTQPLFYKDFVHASAMSFKNGCLGIIDDYVHRQMIEWYHQFPKDGPLLIVGAKPDTLALLLEHFASFVHICSADMPLSLPEGLWIEDFSKWYMYDYDLLDRLLNRSCVFIEKDVSTIKTRFFETFSVSLFFDKQMAERLLASRMMLTCDEKRHIGLLVRKDGCYRCQIQSGS